MKMDRKASGSAIVLLSFSLAVCFQAARYPFGSISRIGPGFLPFYASLALAALSLVILLQALLAPGRKEPELISGSRRRNILKVGAVIFSMAAYAFLLDKLGFPITTFFFTLILFKFCESYRWMPALLGGLIASMGNYLIFSLWLQCQFPKGWLGI
jgi:putative tricarboxylic transport membrane protein